MTVSVATSKLVRTAILLALVVATACASVRPPPRRVAAAGPGAGGLRHRTGFLVVAPDRGFLGNEEIRDAVRDFAASHVAEVVFVTGPRTRDRLEGAVTRLRERGSSRVVVLPLFVTGGDPRWTLARAQLGRVAPDARIAMRFGASYLAVEALADRFRRIPAPSGRRVVVVGYGARDEDSRRRMAADLARLARSAAEGFGFEDVRVVVWPAPAPDPEPPSSAAPRDARDRLAAAVEGGDRPVVVPFHLGPKLDSMMAFGAALRRAVPPGTESLDLDLTPDPLLTLWMHREANRATLTAADVGAVILAHGADFEWNETVRRALAPLEARYRLEFAFCMADPRVVERAVRRLEARGARGIVVVRVFGMASSFRAQVERMLGIDVERGQGGDGAGSHGHHHGHGHPGKGAGAPMRIRTAAVTTTLGGLEDHPLFARALVDRAREVSEDPSRETIVLVAHGLGDDAANEHWLRVLESLARRMRAYGAEDFRAIEVATWREDWPDARGPWIERIRTMVRRASEDGRAIVLPARTNAHGPERTFLEGLEYRLGRGFAPHPLFARWVEEQILAGRARLLGARGPAVPGASHRVGGGGSRGSGAANDASTSRRHPPHDDPPRGR